MCKCISLHDNKCCLCVLMYSGFDQVFKFTSYLLHVNIISCFKYLHTGIIMCNDLPGFSVP